MKATPGAAVPPPGFCGARRFLGKFGAALADLTAAPGPDFRAGVEGAVPASPARPEVATARERASDLGWLHKYPGVSVSPRQKRVSGAVCAF